MKKIGLLSILIIFASIFGSCTIIKSRNEPLIKVTQRVNESVSEGTSLTDKQQLMFRNDLIKMISELKDKANIDLPIFKNFNDNVKADHIFLLKSAIEVYKQQIINDDKTYQEIPPILQFICIEAIDKPLVGPKEDGVYYYKASFYQNIIPKYEYEKNKVLYSPNDGFIDYYIFKIQKVDGEWKVIYFGPDS